MHSLIRTLAMVALAAMCMGVIAGPALAAPFVADGGITGVSPSDAYAASSGGFAGDAFATSDNGTGTITVDANVDGATFSVHGPQNYNNQTAPWSASDAPVGDYTISWGNVTGYTTPAGDSGTLEDGGSITFTGNYEAIPQPGTITVNATVAGATFSITGPQNYSGMVPRTFTNAPAGDYTITWGDLAGFATPSPDTQIQTLLPGLSIAFVGNYVEQIGTINVISVPEGAAFDLNAADGSRYHAGRAPWSASDAPAGGYTIVWGNMVGYTTPPNETQSLTDGGNITFTGTYIDTTPPVISGVGATNLLGTSVTIRWTTNENADSQVDYGLTTSYGSTTPRNTALVQSHNVALTGLTPKTIYHYRVTSIDASLNKTQSADYAFTTIDIDAPVISNVAADNITGVGATITWTTDDPAESQVEYGEFEYGSYSFATPLYETPVTNHSVDLTGLSSQTTYHYKVKSRDASGLWAESVDYSFRTPDVTAAGIEGVVATDISATTASIIWLTSENATSQVEYGVSTSYGFTTSLDPTLVRNHSVGLTGLSAKTTYHYRVKSTDAAGLVSGSGDFTFTTTDTNAPVISHVKAVNITGIGATITWTTDDPADSQVEYGKLENTSYSSTTTLDTNRVTSHSVNLTGLSAQTAYHYKVKSRDASGLWAESSDYTFTTGADPGGIPPVISFAKAMDMTGSTATISWATDREATSQVEYGLTTDYGKTSALDGTLLIYHSVDLKGLKAYRTYHYRVISTDAFGNQAQSEDLTFDTTIGKAPSLRLPTWAWALIGSVVAAVVAVLVVREH